MRGGPSLCPAHVFPRPLPHAARPCLILTAAASLVSPQSLPAPNPPPPLRDALATASPPSSSSRSTPMDGHDGGTPEGAYGDGGRYGQDGAYGDGGPTGVPYNPVYPPAYGMAPSSSLQPSRLDLGRLDLNSTSAWEDSQGPPPVRVPARAGRGTLGLRGERGLGGCAFLGGGSAHVGGGSTHVGGGAAFLGASSAAAGGGSAFMGGHTTGGGYAFMGGQAAGVAGGYGPYGGQAAAMAGGSGPYGGYVPPTPNAGGSARGPSRGGRRRNMRRRVGEDMDRGKWTDPLIKKFCEIYCVIMDTGNHNCIRGKMTSRGWEEVSNRFQFATTIFHDSEQFGYLLRKLKKKWNFIDKKLRKGSGLGRGDATTIQANDHWWEQNAGTDTDLLTLRDGLPDYVDEMDKMFTGFVADGSTSYAPGQRTVHHIPSDDDEDEEAEEADDQDVGTPVSVGSKRSTSSRSTTSVRSTASSPHKKLRSPAVRAMCEKIGGLTAAIGDSRVFFNDAISQRAALKEAAQQAALRAAKEAAEQKRKEDEAQMDRVIELAKECGFTEESPEWIGVLNILNNEKATAWFLKNGIPGRITTIKNYAYRVEDPAPSLADNSNASQVWDDDDESDEEFEQLVLATYEHEQAIAAAALYVHDMRVFDDAMDKWGHVFPHPPQGKFYLVDSGYPNRPGYLAPYKTTRYHLEEFRNAEEPQGKEEFFNYAHSSLKNCIERAFGVLKQKFRILMGIPSYPLETQTHIVVACMALHNFIRLSQESDRDFARCDRDPNYVPAATSVEQPPTEEVPVAYDSRQMNEFRDCIALQMFLDVQ